MKTITLIYIAGWYFSAIALSLYNKWMFDPKNGLGVSYPILVTVFHQTILWILAFIYIKIENFNKRPKISLDDMENIPRASAPAPAPTTTTTTTTTNEHKNDWKFYLKYLIPTAVATAGDIGFSNVSFKFVPLTIYTTIKSSSIAFVLLFSCIFKIEKFHWKLSMIVSIMFIGVVMMVYKPNSTSNDEIDDYSALIFGAFLVLAAACLSGLRWVYTQLILRNKPEPSIESRSSSNQTSEVSDLRIQQRVTSSLKKRKTHPMYTIYQLAPIMGITLFITALIIEKPFPGIFQSNLFKVSPGVNDTITKFSICKGFILLIIPGICVFILTYCEFGILQHTKVLTMSIAGIIKEVLTIIFSMIVLGERLSGIYNWIGMTIVLLDVSYYNYFRYKQKIEQKYEHIGNDNVDDTNANDNSMTEQYASDSFIEEDDEGETSNQEEAEFVPYSITTDSVLQEYELHYVVSNKLPDAIATPSENKV
ncbi:Ymd8p NDAI_0C00750 [Naumovozyma dairenensis CBS 421]|uniref:Sugar phosphate transporter domain-containing protein n=1 Tax=Naumovozyma dairenensis (strain ATCC 10597 / BCRC 20456 / CBS 421 / NBRC 0211 / NRRL Y-12639) TaxID=1071378 RepID=G0W7H5_NAUDC|nr:hypothetical protein NDAI_0C00750 [Naumovozyma dairenensis CBS 421]CCD23736.1 hypothetical protein NDAI_0C00750 [Naumovozyma dairenensis CBS 421]